MIKQRHIDFLSPYGHSLLCPTDSYDLCIELGYKWAGKTLIAAIAT